MAQFELSLVRGTYISVGKGEKNLGEVEIAQNP